MVRTHPCKKAACDEGDDSIQYGLFARKKLSPPYVIGIYSGEYVKTEEYDEYFARHPEEEMKSMSSMDVTDELVELDDRVGWPHRERLTVDATTK
eukprot:4265735-Pyramimonas_sp.AAC.1